MEEIHNTEKHLFKLTSRLFQLGYLEKNKKDEIKSMSDLKGSIKLLQKTFKSKETGTLDSYTRMLLSSPRCNYPDIIETNSFIEDLDTVSIPNFALDNSEKLTYFNKSNTKFVEELEISNPWDTNELRYNFSHFTQIPDIANLEIEEIFMSAFDVWSSMIPMKFTKSDENPHIIIQWTNRSHDHPRYEFGSEDELAHAFGPYGSYGGCICFNNDVYWSKNEENGRINILNNAVHEIGHVLGLSHNCNNNNSVMWPYYPQRIVLDHDDISIIQQLYGTPM